jgi:chaperonin cofactor prefoldin
MPFVLDVLMSNISSDIQNSNSAVVESLRKSVESFICRIQARDKQLESLESDIRNLNVELDKKDDKFEF